MKFRKTALMLISLLALTSCFSTGTDTPTPTPEPEPTPAPSKNTISFPNQEIGVFGDLVEISPVFSVKNENFTVSYEGTNIRISDNKIVGLKAGTTTDVTLTSESGLTCTFTVLVTAKAYKATNARDGLWAESEGWFRSTTVSEISNMSSDFMNGIDISSVKALYDNGTAFFNNDGVQQSIFQILKEAGINWIRAKLWVDPYTSDGTSYGGGSNDLETTTWILKEAKIEGFKLFLDLHYSDYWTHPGHQVVPKAWKSISSADELATKIKQYTKDVLTNLKNENCLPDMVQVGNEISSGMFLQYPDFTSETINSDGEPTYMNVSTVYEHKADAGSANMSKYIQAGIEGVKEVSNKIKTAVHWAKGSSISAARIINFFNSITANYDYAAISYYPFYCFNTLEEGKAILNGLSAIGKPWFIAETSYPFSGGSYVDGVTNFIINNWSITANPKKITDIHTSYPFTMEGQANMIHDLTKSTVDAGGLGIFYWEGAWVPNKNVGWAAKGSTNSWGNQGFFSYNGKPIANLNLFKQMSPHI